MSHATNDVEDGPHVDISRDIPREVRHASILSVNGSTGAYNVFNANMTQLESLLCLAFSHQSFRLADTPRSQFFLQSRIDCIENDLSGPWVIQPRSAMLSWQVVMLVTAVEVYLKEALTTLALFDPTLMRERESVQKFSYDDLRAASDSDSVLRDFCYNWARSKIDGRGGPPAWMEWLRGIGVSPLSSDKVTELDGVWGLRHQQVHDGGLPTPEFIRRHRSLAERLFANEGITLDDLLSWRELATELVGQVEQAIVGRLTAHLGDQIAAGQKRTGDYMLRTLQEKYKNAVEEIGREELDRRAAQVMDAAEERFWRMDYSRKGEVPTYPGAHWRESSEVE